MRSAQPLFITRRFRRGVRIERLVPLSWEPSWCWTFDLSDCSEPTRDRVSEWIAGRGERIYLHNRGGEKRPQGVTLLFVVVPVELVWARFGDANFSRSLARPPTV